METTFEIHIPSSFLSYGFNQNEIRHRIQEWITISLFTEGYISSGKASNLLNMNRLDFIDLLNSRGIAYINYTSKELEEEFASVENLKVGSIK
ncbi:conserved hypothetical protein [Candidatus Magnetomoraceae bacterium gMMP-15]